jgi:ABC-2 type transport system permease protein
VTQLLGIELRRLFARRLTRLTALALFLGIVAAGIGMAVNSDRDLAGAQRRAVAEQSTFIHAQAEGRQQCLTSVPADQAAEQCPPVGEPPPVASFLRDPRMSFQDHVRDLIRSGAVIGALVGLLLSASFIGAEWQAGTFASWLTWEPRRLRVGASKVGAAVVGSVAVALVGTGLLIGVAALVAGTRGTFDSVLQGAPPQPHFAEQTWTMGGRAVAIVALLAAIGAGLALLLRHTVAALGVAIGYLIVGEGVIGQLNHGDVRHHLLQSRLNALLDGRYSWLRPSRAPDGSIGFSADHEAVVHASAASIELIVVVAVLLGVAGVALRRRDIT